MKHVLFIFFTLICEFLLAQTNGYQGQAALPNVDINAADDVKMGDPAGGSLIGTFPNPKIAQNGASEGQFLIWSGTDWQAASPRVDGDSSSVNEIQSLAIAGNTITLSKGGGSVLVPLGEATTYTQSATISNSATMPALNLSIKANSVGVAELSQDVKNQITASTNHIGGDLDVSQNPEMEFAQTQNMGSALGIPYLDENGKQFVITEPFVPYAGDFPSVTAKNGKLEIAYSGAETPADGGIKRWDNGCSCYVNSTAPILDNDAQTLTYAGNTLAISGGNSVTINSSVTGTAPISVTGGNVISHATSGVVAGVYGSGIAIPTLTIDTKGHVTSATTTAITPAAPPSDFWRSGTGATTLPDGATDLTESIRHNGSVGFGTDAPVQSTLDVKGSVAALIVKTSAATFAAGDQHTIVCELNAAQTLTSPAASAVKDRIYTIVNPTPTQKTVWNYKTLAGVGGVTSTVLPANATIKLQSDGVDWWQIDGESAQINTGGAIIAKTPFVAPIGTAVTFDGLQVRWNTAATTFDGIEISTVSGTRNIQYQSFEGYQGSAQTDGGASLWGTANYYYTPSPVAVQNNATFPYTKNITTTWVVIGNYGLFQNNIREVHLYDLDNSQEYILYIRKLSGTGEAGAQNGNCRIAVLKVGITGATPITAGAGISISSNTIASTARAGKITVGDVGNSSANVPVSEGYFASATKSSTATSSTIAVTMPALASANYALIVTVESLGASSLTDNDLGEIVVKSKTATGFVVVLEKTSAFVQNVALNITVTPY